MSAPTRIYLQVPDDCVDYDDAAKGEVTWCADSINPADVEYVLASEAREIIASELEAEWRMPRGAASGPFLTLARWLRSRSTEANPTKEET